MKRGSATAARIPNSKITTTSSIMVKPRSLRRTCCILSLLKVEPLTYEKSVVLIYFVDLLTCLVDLSYWSVLSLVQLLFIIGIFIIKIRLVSARPAALGTGPTSSAFALAYRTGKPGTTAQF